MFCISCGAALPDNAAFCPSCGAKAAKRAKAEAPSLHSLRCTACGSSNLKKLHAGEYRCEHCGTQFFTDEQTPVEDAESADVKVAVLLSEAYAYAEKKDYQNELQTLAKAMELDPENDTVLLRLGRAYARLGSYEKALEYYRIAEKLYPDDPIVYVNIASAYTRLGHYADAKEQYEKGIAMIEADPMCACLEDVAVTYGSYALCIGKLGDRKNAKKYLKIAKEKGYNKESIDSVCRQLQISRFLI